MNPGNKKEKKRLKKQRKNFRLWHRRIGISVSLLLIWLAVTGLFLNHGADLSLDKKTLSAEWVKRFYDVELPEFYSFNVGEGWVSLAEDSRLYFQSAFIDFCELPLHGAV